MLSLSSFRNKGGGGKSTDKYKNGFSSTFSEEKKIEIKKRFKTYFNCISSFYQ